MNIESIALAGECEFKVVSLCFVDISRPFDMSFAKLGDVGRSAHIELTTSPLYRQRGPDREDVPKRCPVAPLPAGAAPMLSTWPIATIMIVCARCSRRDEHEVEALLRNGGARLTDLRLRLTADCPRRGAASIYERCGAMFIVDVGLALAPRRDVAAAANRMTERDYPM